jgi:hypothetical protein
LITTNCRNGSSSCVCALGYNLACRNLFIILNSKKAYFLAESGSEDALYRIKNNKQISTSEIITLGTNKQIEAALNENETYSSLQEVLYGVKQLLEKEGYKLPTANR